MKLGERYYGEGDYENAFEYYNKALELEADNWKAVFVLMLLLIFVANLVTEY